jgi:hypothetical protein
MADFATALRTRLIAPGPVKDIVGTKIYWGIVPQSTALPYIRLQTISDPRPEHLGGYQSTRTTRVQCDCFSDDYAVARDLAEKVVAAVNTPGATGTIHFGRVKAEGPRDLGEDIAGTYVHRASLDLLVEHKLA